MTQQDQQFLQDSPETSHLAQSSRVSQHLIHKDILFHHQARQLIEIPDFGAVKSVLVVFWWDIQHVDNIDYITISTTGNAQDFGDINTSKKDILQASSCKNSHGVFNGGADAWCRKHTDFMQVPLEMHRFW